MTLFACDIDLRKVYCVNDNGVVVANAAPDGEDVIRAVRGAWAHTKSRPTVLLEVAGAVDYTDNKAVAHNKRRWTIWNIATAAYLANSLCDVATVLVAPSSAWTRGSAK